MAFISHTVPGKQSTQEEGSGKGRERQACLGKVQMSVWWEKKLMERVGKEAGKWFETS